jgi:hypothetical protein
MADLWPVAVTVGAIALAIIGLVWRQRDHERQINAWKATGEAPLASQHDVNEMGRKLNDALSAGAVRDQRLTAVEGALVRVEATLTGLAHSQGAIEATLKEVGEHNYEQSMSIISHINEARREAASAAAGLSERMAGMEAKVDIGEAIEKAIGKLGERR